MQVRLVRSVLPPVDAPVKVTAVAWSPNSTRLAVATHDRVITLFDENGEAKKDRFSTKPADAARKDYAITGIAWSPDSTKLAVAQSDNIVFVYKLGLSWDDKKSICNKFPQTSSVTCIAWPVAHAGDVAFGLAEGKLRLGSLRSNKAATLYGTDNASAVVALAASPDGHALLAAHVDGAIYRFVLGGEGGAGGGGGAQKFAHHSCPPAAIAWGAAVVAVGSDGRASFYGADGALARTFDYSAGASAAGAGRDLVSAAFSPSGEAVAVGVVDGFLVFTLAAAAAGGCGGAAAPAREWAEAATRTVPGFYAATALGWKPDGAKLAVGSVAGACDVYDLCLRRARYRGKFEFTFVSLSTVIVKRLSTGMRIVLRSSFGYEVSRIRIHGDRYLTARTPATLLMGDLESCRLSEIAWAPLAGGARGGRGADGAAAAAPERFLFDVSPTVCLVERGGALTLVEYGRTEPLGSFRTEHAAAKTLSVRVHEAGGGAPARKTLAYLLDAHTVVVVDLAAAGGPATLATVALPDSRVTALELSARGALALVRDARRRLHLLDVAAGTRTTLLPYCSFARWAPGSDVLVAQRRSQLCVWYNIRAPDKVTVYDIRGDVEGIERAAGRCDVIVDEGITTASYQLDEALIGYGAAMDARDWPAAAATLEALGGGGGGGAGALSPEAEGMWTRLGREAEAAGDVAAAARAAVALGDAARARFLARAAKAGARRAGGGAAGAALVGAHLAALRRDLPAAEAALVGAGRVGDAVDLFASLGRGDDAAAVADAAGRAADAAALRAASLAHLLATGQEDAAGGAAEAAGDAAGAVALYLKSGRPGRALGVAFASFAALPREVHERIVAALVAGAAFDKAGALLERLGEPARALDAYVRGCAWRAAVDLARRHAPARVVELERSWGRWLVAGGAVEAAVHHFIEAGAHAEAIDAALAARQHAKAAALIDDTLARSAPAAAAPYWRRLARAYAARGAHDDAERCYLRAGDGRAAVEMHLSAGRADAALRVGRASLPEGDVTALFGAEAARLEAAGSLRAAERLLVATRAHGAAAAMYRRARDWESSVRVIAAGGGGGGGGAAAAVRDAHASIGAQLLAEGGAGAARDAERHLVAAGDWSGAAAAHRAAGAWDDALRVARAGGGPAAAHAVALEQALALGSAEAAARLLERLGVAAPVVDAAAAAGKLDFALDLAGRLARDRLPALLLKRAMAAEDAGEWAAAERDFCAAGKPREAVDMLVHARDWAGALRVADAHDPSAVPDVLAAEAAAAAAAGDMQRAEALWCDAGRPEAAVEAYLAAGARGAPDALRVAKRHLPHRVAEYTDRVRRAAQGGAPPPTLSPEPPPRAGAGAAAAGARARAAAGAAGVDGDPIAAGRMWEEAKDWPLAINAYLSLAGPGGAHDAAACEKAWTRAAALAMAHDKGRWVQVVEEAAARLAENRRWEAAGDLFVNLGAPERAADCFVRAGAWAKARGAAAGGPPALADAVRAAERKAAVDAGDADAMAAAGATDAALKAYAAAGEWDKCFAAAAKAGAKALGAYLLPHARALLAGDDPARGAEALRLFGAYGAPPEAAALPVYAALVTAVFAPDRGPPPARAAVAALRAVLYALVAGLRRAGAPSGEAERLLLAVHYAGVRAAALELGLAAVAARAALVLARFTDVLPADRVYFDAGVAARAAGDRGAALVLLNRFIDVADAIEDGARDGARLDNADFAGAGFLAPADFALPRRALVAPAEREEAKEWVLAASMDRAVRAALPTRACAGCAAALPECALECGACRAAAPACVVTGFPIPRGAERACKACGSKAIAAFFDDVVKRTKVCVWCGGNPS